MWLPRLLNDVASSRRDQHAVVHKDCVLTFVDLQVRTERLACALKSKGVRRGDRVCVLLDHSVDSVILFWAILKAGAICVNLNEQFTSNALNCIIRDCSPRLIFSSLKISAKKLKVSSVDTFQLVDIESPLFAEMCLCNVNAELPHYAEDDIAVIIYTSGSTGAPKGVCLTHRSLHTVVVADTAYYQLCESDSYLMVVPLHYVHGLMQLLIHLLNGNKVILAGGFIFPTAITKQLAQSGATGVSGVPYHIAALIDRGGFLQADLPGLKWIGITAGKLDEGRLRQLKEFKPDLRVHVTYGQTECSPRITALDPELIMDKPGSVGRSPPGIDIDVVDDNGHSFSRGETGEVVVRGANVMAGYWNDRQLTDSVIDSEGWLHTGDLGWLDEQGDLFLVGRKQTMIKSAGERIFPEEIESILLKHRKVESAAVVGVVDELYGQRVEAHLKLKYGHSVRKEDLRTVEADIRNHCLQYLPIVRSPKQYHFWETDFPRKPNGKLDRMALIDINVPCSDGDEQ